MPLHTKRKGSDWEREATKILIDSIKRSSWRRIPGSGAIGTTMLEPFLTGDIMGIIVSMPRKFKIECKVGYGGSKQFVLKKEWLDKIKQEAGNYYSIPLLMGKFSGAKEGVKSFVVMDTETFAFIMNHMTDLWEEQNLKE